MKYAKEKQKDKNPQTLVAVYIYIYTHTPVFLINKIKGIIKNKGHPFFN